MKTEKMTYKQPTTNRKAMELPNQTQVSHWLLSLTSFSSSITLSRQLALHLQSVRGNHTIPLSRCAGGRVIQ